MRVHLGDFTKSVCPHSPTAGTLSTCVDEKTGDHPVHAAALLFLAAVFTEETKSRGAEVQTSTSTAAAASIRDIVNSPAAGRLCELLLQVHVEAKG